MAQLVREHQYQDDTVLRPMQLKVVGDELFATVEAFDEQENFENRLRSQLTLRRHSERASTDDDVTNQSELAAGNQESELSATFAHVGPGLYEARLKLPGPGAYSVKAHHHLVVADRVVPAGMSLGSVSVPYREEFRDLQPREAELSSWAEQFRGVANPRLDEVWSAQGDVLFTKRARHNDFILLAIGLFFLDLLLRRVRLFDRNFKQ
jgi:hypothetical protein